MTEALKPCPFDCDDTPRLISRVAADGEGAAYVAFAVCYCGGYASCAHKTGYGVTAAEAEANATAAWNRRVTQPVAPGWISVKDRQPEVGDSCFVAAWAWGDAETSRIYGHAVYEGGGVYRNTQDEDGPEWWPPTHWMTLPPPPPKETP